MRKYLLLLIPLLLLSCTNYKFEITTDVEAEVVGHAVRTIGLKFELYDHMMLLDVYNLKLSEMAFFSKMKTIPLTVKVYGNDFSTSPVSMKLYYKNERFGQETSHDLKIPLKKLINRHREIPNFTWYVYDGDGYDGITSQELTSKLREDGKSPPEEINIGVTIEPVKGDDKNL